MNLGIIVQNNSRGWDSSINWSMFLLNEVEIKLNPTIVTIRIKIVIVWSWKKISCSMRGEAAFWRLRADQVEISKGNTIHNWSLNSAHFSATLEIVNQC